MPEPQHTPGMSTLEQLFHQCFFDAHRTRLQGGAAEPLYTPASAASAAIIYYREDFPASALHEVAHWCLAGPDRRKLEDYGYWYEPDGRTLEQQRQFELVEAKPQAIEWHFALAGGLPFRVSFDNLGTEPAADGEFAQAVLVQARQYCQTGLPERAAKFRDALAASRGGQSDPRQSTFLLAGVGP
ncbi:MAG: elongation factor P hydroxylase [Halieaceae bacterium]